MNSLDYLIVQIAALLCKYGTRPSVRYRCCFCDLLDCFDMIDCGHAPTLIALAWSMTDVSLALTLLAQHNPLCYPRPSCGC